MFKSRNLANDAKSGVCAINKANLGHPGTGWSRSFSKFEMSSWHWKSSSLTEGSCLGKLGTLGVELLELELDKVLDPSELREDLILERDEVMIFIKKSLTEDLIYFHCEVKSSIIFTYRFSSRWRGNGLHPQPHGHRLLHCFTIFPIRTCWSHNIVWQYRSLEAR